MNELKADILVVGGGTGGTAAAVQAARRGAKTILISEFPWLGGMLTTAGVSAPDGNELAAFQTGLWGAFLRELQQQQPGGLDRAWVSFFTYDPRIGAKIFADWVKQLPNLYWIAGQTPQKVLKKDNKIVGVRFEDFTVHAQITLDATELGDLLAIGEIPYRWGWEFQAEWGEPSAPITPNILTETYPVQAPTWVVIMQDFGADTIAPEIPAPPIDNPSQFVGAWDNYGPEKFLNYGRLPGNRFMINWPLRGNDYGEGVNRLIESESSKREFLQESLWHTQSFARFIQNQLGRRYGLAKDIFPVFKMVKSQDGEIFTNHQLPITNHQLPITNSAFALHPYYRESRRLRGLATIKEQDILPIASGKAASLPVNANGECVAIAIANYANDHHYTSGDIPLEPKSLRWGGRWTGTPFTIPYTCLIPAETEGLLTCEKNISVSHIANGATRLQPAVMGIGQAAGMAAALCIERGIQPRELPVRVLQEALLQDPIAPAAIVPLFNLTPNHPDWLYWQRYYLDRPTEYPASGNCPCTKEEGRRKKEEGRRKKEERITNYQLPITNYQLPITNYQFSGIFYRRSEQDYELAIAHPPALASQTWKLVTLDPGIDSFLQNCESEKPLTVWGRLNFAGCWLLIEST